VYLLLTTRANASLKVYYSKWMLASHNSHPRPNFSNLLRSFFSSPAVNSRNPSFKTGGGSIPWSLCLHAFSRDGKDGADDPLEDVHGLVDEGLEWLLDSGQLFPGWQMLVQRIAGLPPQQS
jgi:hypothetical protein